MLGRLTVKQIQLLGNRTSMSVLAMTSMVTVGAIASVTAYWVLHQHQSGAVNVPTIEPFINSVTALGYLAPQGEIIRLAAPTPNQRLTELRVKEGDRVQVNQIIGVIDNLKEYEASVNSAKAQVNVARARLTRVQAGEEAGVIESQNRKIASLKAQLAGDTATQQAVLARQKIELANSETDYRRYETLAQAGAISKADATHKQLQAEVARVRFQEEEARLQEIVDTGRQRIEEAKASLTSLATVQPTDVLVAQAELSEALSQLHKAEVVLDSLYVRSPIAGQILRLNVKVGELVGPGGIAEIGKTQQMYVIGEVYASDRQYVKIGQPVTIASDYDGFGGELTGVVESIDLQIVKPDVVANDPAEDTDVRVVKVKIRLNPQDSEQVKTLSNLEVRASIQIHRPPVSIRQN
ncbi:HlyD family efflux transporter periplasmic adaptor subunit [Trichocoleus sp. FACHB-262]|uniref:HlyD family efflux transporter periplasmic adaptor subunit n=1 Tax=Trichocoleus sp. FACHB-262 TaxID=2692869 RepID=UPI0016889958|nr:HlyD family efflux transporter periplasmic adaptor subunit [Trichocoleus sp. FACHB-262]MBD2124657.1 HlyD family efflux transporter periplasmic adaptor subunit [Trichocoleus sp. FACHB-262]